METGSNNVMKMSPRQRMINLMYIVLTAMLALNVSSDVLNGFNRVHDGLHKSASTLISANDARYADLQALFEHNQVKAGEMYKSGTELRSRSRRLVAAIDSLRVEIARHADGKKGDPARLVNREDLDAATDVMLTPPALKGAALRRDIEGFRAFALPLIPEGPKRDGIRKALATDPEKREGSVGNVTWETAQFESMPAVAAITLLTKLKTDVLQAESEALSGLIASVDAGDIKVNSLQAYVIPNSRMVMQGGRYSADIVLAAVDTTQRPEVFVNGARLGTSGHYEFTASTPGNHQFSGYIEARNADGNIIKHPFSSSYTVIEPMATVSATMMNVLYAGIDNPISISVPGIDQNSIQATMTNGTLTRKGTGWVARPAKIGTPAEISVSASVDGNTRHVGSTSFRVRKLPDPSPYMIVKEGANTVHYKGTPKRISKAALLSCETLGAAADDDMLNVAYSVVSFSTVFLDQMGNGMPEHSDGAHFSARQKEQFRRLKSGRRFFITSVRAKGPDGIVRDISPMEVALN